MLSVLSVLLALWFTGAAAQAVQPPTQNQVIEDVRFSGNRRVRSDTLKYQVQTKKGDVLNQAVIQRDVRTIYALGSIDDVKVYTDQGEKGVIVNFWIQERPYIRQVVYQGLKSLTQSDIVDKLREKKASL